MRIKTLILILFIFCRIDVNADCAGSGIYVWPDKHNLNPCQVFVITGYAEDQHTVRNLNIKHPVFLKNGSHIVKLKVTEICEGEFWETQVVLVPEKELQMGGSYTLVIDSLPKWSSITRYLGSGKHEPYNWVVTDEKDSIAPKWTEKPVEFSKEYHSFGCGPARLVNFRFKVEENSPFLIKAIVKNKLTHKIISFYLEPDTNTVSVGHGMCGGMLDYNGGDKYEITFEIMDASGNILKWDGLPVVFTKPTERDHPPARKR